MRWIVRFGVGLAVLVLLALGLMAMVPTDRVAQLVSDEFERVTGRKLVLTGELRPRVWPTLGVTTGPVSIANADWAEGEGPLFQAQSLSIDINSSALMGGEVRIIGLSADQPEIALERDRTGRGNWEFSEGGGPGAVPPAANPFTLDIGRITGGTLRLVDRQAGIELAFEALDAQLAIPDFGGEFTFAATALARGKAVALDLKGGVFSAFAAGRVVPMTVSLSAGGSRVGFEGRGGVGPLAAEGALVADLSDLPALGAIWGAVLTQPMAGLGSDTLTVKGQMTLDGSGGAFLRGAEIVADTNSLRGDLDLAPGTDRPKLSAQLTAAPIRIGSDTSASGEGWSKDAIDVSALGAMDAELSLSAPSVAVGGVTLGETRVLVTLDRARAVTDIRQMSGYGGAIAGQFVVNGRGGLSVGGKLTFSGMDLQALLKDLAGYDRLVARGDLELQFLGVGNSVDAIMRSLKGEGALELGQGELRGLDVAGMLRTLDTGFVGEGQKTIFDGLAGTFAISDGVLTNSDLKLVAPYLTASGNGMVGLGGRTLDYRLRPTALAGEDGTGGVMVPLLITGTWAVPKFRLDLESIAREKMEAEAKAAAAAAEAKAKAALEQKLKDELGIEAGEGESLEDAAKRRAQEAIEDEARKVLEGILGGN